MIENIDRKNIKKLVVGLPRTSQQYIEKQELNGYVFEVDKTDPVYRLLYVVKKNELEDVFSGERLAYRKNIGSYVYKDNIIGGHALCVDQKDCVPFSEIVNNKRIIDKGLTKKEAKAYLSTLNIMSHAIAAQIKDLTSKFEAMPEEGLRLDLKVQNHFCTLNRLVEESKGIKGKESKKTTDINVQL